MVSNDTTTEQLDQLLQSVILKEEIGNPSIQVKSGSEEGDGYIGIMTSIQINGTGKDGQQKTINIIAKRPPQSEAVRKMMPVRTMYLAEIYLYKEVIPIFKKFEQTHNSSGRCNFTAKCFGTSSEECHETLLLQDLNYVGYKMYNRWKAMDEKHVRLLLDTYARLHAFSFAIKEQQPEVYEEIKRNCLDTQSVEEMDKDCYMYYSQYDFLIETYQEDKEIIEFSKRMREDIPGIFRELHLDGKTGPNLVVGHGDCWCNNMMFAYGESSEDPTNAILLDWQLSKMSNVCLDVCFFFYCSSSQEIIDNYEEYMEYYYSRLTFHVKALGTSLETMYPFEDFKGDWMLYRKFGLTLALIIVRMMVTKKEEAVDITKVVESGEDFYTCFNYKCASDDIYYSRVKGLLLHFMNTEV